MFLFFSAFGLASLAFSPTRHGLDHDDLRFSEDSFACPSIWRSVSRSPRRLGRTTPQVLPVSGCVTPGSGKGGAKMASKRVKINGSINIEGLPNIGD